MPVTYPVLLVLISLFLSFSECLLANEYIDSLKIELIQASTDSKRSELCKLIGNRYYPISEDSIMKYYDLSSQYANKSDTHKDDAEILRAYGYYNTNLSNDYIRAISYYEEALELSESNNDQRNISLIKNDLGIVYWKKGGYQKAIEYYFEANEIAESMDDPDLQMRTLLSLGVIHNEALRNEEAKDYYKAALPLAVQLGHQRANGIILNNIGKVYRDLEDYTTSHEYFEKALIVFEASNDDYWKGLCYYNIAYNYYFLKQFKKAIDTYEIALSLNEILQDKDREIMILFGLAETNEASGQDKKAMNYALQCLKLLEDIDTKLYHYDLNIILARCYEREGDFKKSSFYFQKNIDSKYDVNSTNKHQELAKMKAMYENERKIDQINQLEIQNKENIINKQRATYKFRFSVVLFLFILSMCGLFFYGLKLKQLKRFDALRTKLTNDLHDNVGSSLNQIKMLAGKLNNRNDTNEKETAAEISIIKTISNDLISNMYDLIWSINKDKEVLDDLLNHMRDHASNVFSPMELPYRMKINNDYINKVIDAEVKNNIYSLYKEAINNVVKHTRPELVQIYVDVVNNKLNLKIENDKKNILENQLSNKRGLKSMKDRAKLINGRLNIKDETNQFIVNFQVSI